MRAILFVTLLSLTLLLGCASSSEKTTSEQPQPAVAEQPAPEPVTQPATAKNKKAKAAKEDKSVSVASKGHKTEAQIKTELDDTARKLTAQAARTVRPSKATKEVKKTGQEHVANYVEVDTVNVTTEMRPANKPGLYVGIIRYAEKLYECRGASQKGALEAPCQEVGKSNRTEMIMFDGKSWQY